MNPHMHIVFGGHLRADNFTVILPVNDPQPDNRVRALDERRLLRVFEFREFDGDLKAFGAFDGQSGRDHFQVVDADSVGALNADMLERSSAGVMRGDDAAADGVGREGDVLVASRGVIENGGAVANRVNVGDRGALTPIDRVRAAGMIFQRGMAEGGIRPEPDALDDHVRRDHPFIGSDAADVSVFSFVAEDLLPEREADPMRFKILDHAFPERLVVVLDEDRRREIDQRDGFPDPAKGFGEFDADIPCADDGDRFEGVVIPEFFDDLFGVLIKLDVLDIFEVRAGDRKLDRSGAGREDELYL